MLLEWLPIIIALLITGVLAGVLAGLLGVGGGIVIVPVLFFVFQFLGISIDTSMSVATGTSLVIIFATSISSVRSHYAKGNVDIELIRWWWPFIVVGAVLGGFFSANVGGRYASIIFGVIAILVALNMLLRATAPAAWSSLPNKFGQAIIACANGAISVIMGIGGGTLGVPILSACNYPAHRAVGTAAAFGFIIAVPGALLMLLLATTPADAPNGTIGFVNLIGAALIMPLSVAMAPVGVWLGSKIEGPMLKRLFAIFLILSGSRMIFQALVN